MIQVGTRIPVVDKSGAKVALCICVLRSLVVGTVGDRLIVVVKKAVKKRTKRKLAQKSKIYHAVIVKHKIVPKKLSGLTVSFKQKGIIILKKGENEPFSIRINSPVSINLRTKGYLKPLSLAQIIV